MTKLNEIKQSKERNLDLYLGPELYIPQHIFTVIQSNIIFAASKYLSLLILWVLGVPKYNYSIVTIPSNSGLACLLAYLCGGAVLRFYVLHHI